jgi:LuxR family transcriptional regulator of csgAB operon
VISEGNTIYRNAAIYVIGVNNFSNELLYAYLCQEFDIPCMLDPYIECVPKDDNAHPAEHRLVLFDAHGKNLSNVFLELNGFVKELIPQIILAFFNLEPHTGFEVEGLRYGIKGFFYSHESLDLLLKGVRSMLQGELWVSRELLSECIIEDMKTNPLSNLHRGETAKNVLSRRESEILGMVTVGAKNLDIAHKLFISPHTVKTHLYNIYKKICVGDRIQAIRWAAKNFQY